MPCHTSPHKLKIVLTNLFYHFNLIISRFNRQKVRIRASGMYFTQNKTAVSFFFSLIWLKYYLLSLK
jgi:hypothetical protein